MANLEKQFLGIFIIFVAIFTIASVASLGMIDDLPQDLRLTWGILTLLFIIGGTSLFVKGIEEEAEGIKDVDTI